MTKNYPRANFKWNQLNNGSINFSLITQFCENKLKFSTNMDNNRSFPRTSNQCRIDRQNAEFFTRIALYTIKRTKKDLCILCVPCVLIICLTYPHTMTHT